MGRSLTGAFIFLILFWMVGAFIVFRGGFQKARMPKPPPTNSLQDIHQAYKKRVSEQKEELKWMKENNKQIIDDFRESHKVGENRDYKEQQRLLKEQADLQRQSLKNLNNFPGKDPF